MTSTPYLRPQNQHAYESTPECTRHRFLDLLLNARELVLGCQIVALGIELGGIGGRLGCGDVGEVVGGVVGCVAGDVLLQ